MVVNARFWKKVSGVRYDPQEGWRGAKGVNHGGGGHAEGDGRWR